MFRFVAGVHWSVRGGIAVAVLCAGCAKLPAPKPAAEKPDDAHAAVRAPAAPYSPPLNKPDYEKFGKAEAERFTPTARQRPEVYTSLADYLVDGFGLAATSGIGVDIGGGPGDLVFELAARTKRLYWVNADINTWYAKPFAEEALKRDLAHRTAFIFADACALPFKDGYADLVISRGSYPFWGNLEDGLREVHRVLKPGAWAFIGRGTSPAMSADDIRNLRERSALGGPAYDPAAEEARFRSIMSGLNVREFDILRPKPADQTPGYGIWLCFRR